MDKLRILKAVQSALEEDVRRQLAAPLDGAQRRHGARNEPHVPPTKALFVGQ